MAGLFVCGERALQAEGNQQPSLWQFAGGVIEFYLVYLAVGDGRQFAGGQFHY